MKIGVCFWVFCLGLSAGAEASNNRNLTAIQAEIRQVGADVKELAAEKNAQIEQLKKLEKQYGEQINALNSIKAEIKLQEQALQSLRGRISATQKDIQAQHQGLEGLIKSAYVMGDKDGFALILNQRDPALSGRILVYYDYITKARLQKLQAIEEDVKTLRQLESQKDTETQLLQVALERKQQEAEALQTLRNQREKLLAQIDRDYSSKQGRLARLVHDEKKLEALVASFQKTDDNGPQEPTPEPVVENKPVISEQRPLHAPSKKSEDREAVSQKDFAQLQGQLPWPVQGEINERFGSRRFETTWDGAVIGAREGADIHAIASGRVVYADWLRGYGLMIIVDHGKGYLSLYAFNQSLHKSVGEHVRAGESLASVGRSGGRAQASLYFGIRKKGRPVNPEHWCRKPEKS